MLVLKRNKYQSVVIGGGITVKVMAVEGDTVKLGVESPKGVKILRSELLANAPDGSADERRVR